VKLAVVSDIHGNLAALHAVLQDIARQGVDQVVNLGDILSGPLQPAETAEFLMAQGFPTITGNHERQLLQVIDRGGAFDTQDSDGFAATQIKPAHVQWLRSLPAHHSLADDLLLVHGTPASDLVYWLETVTPDFGQESSPGVRAATADEVRERLHKAQGAQRASLVLCGHTHVPRAIRCGDTRIVNPGSVGLQAYEGHHPHYHQVANGSPDARYAIVERQAAGWTARLCCVPYDWAPQAKLAVERGRHDWACALATGRMPPRAATIGA
jgi:predicted phosphodiesterase